MGVDPATGKDRSVSLAFGVEPFPSAATLEFIALKAQALSCICPIADLMEAGCRCGAATNPEAG